MVLTTKVDLMTRWWPGHFGKAEGYFDVVKFTPSNANTFADDSSFSLGD